MPLMTKIYKEKIKELQKINYIRSE